MNDDHSRTESADDSAPQTENTAGIPEPSGEEPEDSRRNDNRRRRAGTNR